MKRKVIRYCYQLPQEECKPIVELFHGPDGPATCTSIGTNSLPALGITQPVCSHGLAED